MKKGISKEELDKNLESIKEKEKDYNEWYLQTSFYNI